MRSHPSSIPRFKVVIVPTIIALMVGVLFFFNPADGGLYPGCWFHRLTGWDCPGCGGLRAAHALLHGRISDAWNYNPVVVALLPFGAWLGWMQWRRRRSHQSSVAVKPATGWLWAGLAALALFGVMRNLPFEWFRWMASGV